MGTTLHNKIYLGRATLLGSRRGKALLAAGLGAGAMVAVVLLRAWR